MWKQRESQCLAAVAAEGGKDVDAGGARVGVALVGAVALADGRVGFEDAARGECAHVLQFGCIETRWAARLREEIGQMQLHKPLVAVSENGR
ncbi:hypothetical protein GGTG_03188 [Gaeumannomyces tritici R3-111a-1]|uniref:Uncharacterized protein n=1 Tax=Gaeumannomyces tritici (strain R3-111a-1) TaxID=644352 RepID=J3NPI0_GAET3|nr:hypothetical protein GGTG_03188 [Gaeumannomyces tritici R3-111a-1]EJT78085.1 hypothetical protein GGTG_03188 [Gaeumannomyces tritici R3-111a-1]